MDSQHKKSHLPGAHFHHENKVYKYSEMITHIQHHHTTAISGGRSTGLEPCWTTKADVVEHLPVTLIPIANSCKSSCVCPQNHCGSTKLSKPSTKANCPSPAHVSHSPVGKRVCRVSSSASSIVKASVFLTSSREGIPSSWPTSSLPVIHSTGVTFLFSSVGGLRGETYNLQ